MSTKAKCKGEEDKDHPYLCRIHQYLFELKAKDILIGELRAEIRRLHDEIGNLTHRLKAIGFENSGLYAKIERFHHENNRADCSYTP